MARKLAFKIPYLGIDTEDVHLLCGSNGEYTAIIRLTNPVLQYSADPAAYEAFHQHFVNLIKILGEGHQLQKQDIFSRKSYDAGHSDDYLQQQYNRHFQGRLYTDINTYLSITKLTKTGRFYTYNKKELLDFKNKIGKVVDSLAAGGMHPVLLEEKEINHLILRILGMEFNQEAIALDNVQPMADQVRFGHKALKCLSLIDVDSIDLPEEISGYTEMQGTGLKGFPVDLMAFLHKVPAYESILYNQCIEIPSQLGTMHRLEVKKRRHAGMPDPANDLCVQDIDRLLTDVARENQLLVHAHFTVMVLSDEEHLDKAVNFIENALFGQGIIPSRASYNQFELYRSALPGNATELKKYDWFLTTSDAATCFFFKEALPQDEPSDFRIRFTDRQGVPVAIDPSDLVMEQNRISNRNRCVIGASGTGKSYLVNALVEQYLLYNTDVLIVDTGHSYSGLNAYHNGKYVTYTEQQPITMNPYSFGQDEYNIEKKEFLSTLTGFLWKGADGRLGQVESDVINELIAAYYDSHFYPVSDEWLCGLEVVGLEEYLSEMGMGLKRRAEPSGEISYRQLLLESALDIRAKREITCLKFDSFYEFSLWKLPVIKKKENIPFNFDEFRYVLKKFYKGGEFERLLNEDADRSLFYEKFIVFEIDNIKNNPTVFPITVLVIMDTFVQKMRLRENRRKVLVLEEAWKAIASPMMAHYLVFLEKTARKFYGELIIVTQEVGDIIDSPIIKDTIISNSDTIFLLDQSKLEGNYQKVAQLLSLNDVEQKKIFTINRLDNTEGRGRFKEVYIKRGTTGEVYGIEVSLAQYLVYTTEAPEKAAVRLYVSQYGSYPEALQVMQEDIRQSKLPLGSFIRQVNQSGKLYRQWMQTA